MIMTEKEFWSLINKKAESELKKDLIRKTFAPQMAEPMCNAIDSKDKTELLEKLHNEWLEYQKRQNDIIQAYLKMIGI